MASTSSPPSLSRASRFDDGARRIAELGQRDLGGFAERQAALRRGRRQLGQALEHRGQLFGRALNPQNARQGPSRQPARRRARRRSEPARRDTAPRAASTLARPCSKVCRLRAAGCRASPRSRARARRARSTSARRSSVPSSAASLASRSRCVRSSGTSATMRRQRLERAGGSASVPSRSSTASSSSGTRASGGEPSASTSQHAHDVDRALLRAVVLAQQPRRRDPHAGRVGRPPPSPSPATPRCARAAPRRRSRRPAPRAAWPPATAPRSARSDRATSAATRPSSSFCSAGLLQRPRSRKLSRSISGRFLPLRSYKRSSDASTR